MDDHFALGVVSEVVALEDLAAVERLEVVNVDLFCLQAGTCKSLNVCYQLKLTLSDRSFSSTSTANAAADSLVARWKVN